MIKLKRITIYTNEEFTSERQLNEFKQKVTAAVASHMANQPTIYNTIESRDNLLIHAQDPTKD